MGKKRLKLGRVFLSMVLITGTIFVADSLRRDFFTSDTLTLKVNGDFRDSSDKSLEAPSEDSQILNDTGLSTTEFQGVQHLGYSEINLSESKLSEGLLSIVKENYPVEEIDKSDMVDLLDYKNEYYTLVSESIKLNIDAAEALNEMMMDYSAATGLYDFVVYGTTETYTGEGSYCPKYFPESAIGNCVDLAVNGYGSVIAYDGYDAESWVIENCHKYGFIVRCPVGKSSFTSNEFCPWHLRYVGEVHSAIMAEKNYCLEEYVSFISAYTFDYPLTYSANGVNYEIYGAKATGEFTAVRVPVSGNYTISGNNIDGFIITVVKN